MNSHVYVLAPRSPFVLPSHFVNMVVQIGWGEFTIKGVVHFQPKFNMPPMVFEHLLSFRGNGTHREYHVVFGGEGQNQP